MVVVPLLLLEACFILLWSSGFIGARFGVPHADPITLLFVRYLLVSVIMIAIVMMRGGLGMSTWRAIGHAAVIGVLAHGVYLVAVFVAIDQGVSAGLTSLVAALQPMLAAALAGPVLSESVSSRQWIGLAIGLFGVTLVVQGDLAATQTAGLWAYALPFLSTLGLTAAALYQRRVGFSAPLASNLAVQATATAVFLGILAFALEDMHITWNAEFFFAIGWLTFMATLGAYGLLWTLLRRSDVTRVTSLVYLTPPVTMIVAFILFREPITVYTIAGLAVAATGVVVVRTQKGWFNGLRPRLLKALAISPR